MIDYVTKKKMMSAAKMRKKVFELLTLLWLREQTKVKKRFKLYFLLSTPLSVKKQIFLSFSFFRGGFDFLSLFSIL